jgi:hypothetical protein
MQHTVKSPGNQFGDVLITGEELWDDVSSRGKEDRVEYSNSAGSAEGLNHISFGSAEGQLYLPL